MRTFARKVCIIPARGGPKRLPGKNIALLAGKPLLQYSIDVARASGLFEAVIVSSEDREILSVAENGGATVRVRPAELATDSAQLRFVCADVLTWLEQSGKSPDAFCVLLPGQPFRSVSDLKESLAVLEAKDVDTVLSVLVMKHPPHRTLALENDLLVPFLGPQYFRPAQEIQKLYRHDGSVAWSTPTAFAKQGSFVQGNVAPFFSDEKRSIDIDEPIDLVWAEFLLSQMRH